MRPVEKTDGHQVAAGTDLPLNHKYFYTALIAGLCLTMVVIAMLPVPGKLRYVRLTGTMTRIADVHGRIAEDPHPVDVAFIGTSHTWTAVADADLERRLMGLGDQVTVANLRTISDRLERGEGTLGRLLSKDDQLYRDAAQTIANLRAATDRLEKGEGTLGKLSRDETLYQDIKGLVGDLISVTP